MSGISSPSSDNPLLSGYKANNYYYGGFQGYDGTGAALTANRIYPCPFYVHSPVIMTRLGIKVNTLAAGAARLGLYTSLNGEPGSLILDAGTVNTGTTGEKEITISQGLAPGLYFTAILANATPTISYSAMYDFVWRTIFGQATLGGTDSQAYAAQAYGSLPSTFPALTYASGSGPMCWMRKV